MTTRKAVTTTRPRPLCVVYIRVSSQPASTHPSSLSTYRHDRRPPNRSEVSDRGAELSTVVGSIHIHPQHSDQPRHRPRPVAQAASEWSQDQHPTRSGQHVTRKDFDVVYTITTTTGGRT